LITCTGNSPGGSGGGGNTYTLTFDGNGNTGGTVPAKITQTKGTATTVPGEGNLVKTGSSFTGWNTAANGAGDSYTEGDVYNKNTSAILYAQWTGGTETTYIVIFNSNGGTSVNSITGVPHDTTITKPADPTRDITGFYSFNGWFKASDYSSEWDFNNDTVTGDITLYAKWIPLKAIGDLGPGNGRIFYIETVKPGGFTVEGYEGSFSAYTAYYLEAAPENMGSTLAWAPFSSPAYTSSVPGLSQSSYDQTDWAIGRGMKNTALILAVVTDNPETNAPAASACNIYVNNNKNDWFLPSRNELDELYKLYAANGHGSYGNLTIESYWSSSQFISGNARFQRFSDGFQHYHSKGNTYRVRPVRAF
jgi:uncharacterized repeat protein (TIGR02543 family)